MRVLLGSALLALSSLAMGNAQNKPIPEFVVKSPTIVAFFPPVTDAELEKNADTNEALGDFQLYATRAVPRLKKAGIAFEVVNAVTFKVRVGKTTSTFRTGKVGIGYYFIAPGRRPRIQYGVMTDEDIVATAHEYFKVAV